MVQDDRFFVSGEDINHGILKAGPGEATKLWGDIFDIHLEEANGWGVFQMHVDSVLESWSSMISIFSHKTGTFQHAMDSLARSLQF